MRYLFVLLILLASSNSMSEELDSLNYNIFKEDTKRQEKLFAMSDGETQQLVSDSVLDDLSSLPYYPVLRLDFFHVFNPDYYKDKHFTYVFKNMSMEYVFGVRLRMSVGYSIR